MTSSFNPLCSENRLLYDFNLKKNLWRLFYDSEHGLSWQIFHKHVKWICIQLLLVKSCSLNINSVNLRISFGHYLLIFLFVLWIIKKGVSKSSIIIACLSIFPFCAIYASCILKLFGACAGRIVMSFWWMEHFVTMQCPLSL